ncbi:hypothetical protein [Bosea sp. (in: a-proteobacteria)]|uniref:hypothetical protein n=1 Tax=Bosea sp. (in: a-proteobacteria) TaxID=1871050 RepID=UPI0027357F03|nr:hypothetical protein [Bosea sp. (in: a-proteobacteria)]MDP3408066.1 hypothetical protein [Bosea sp. (in: a-proteobacteria)]
MKTPDDRIETMKARLHGEILRVITVHKLTYDELFRITGYYFDRSHMYRLREFTNNWSPKKYIHIARSLGIDVPDIIPVPGAPAPKLDAVLATRRAKAAAAEAA